MGDREKRNVYKRSPKKFSPLEEDEYSKAPPPKQLVLKNVQKCLMMSFLRPGEDTTEYRCVLASSVKETELKELTIKQMINKAWDERKNDIMTFKSGRRFSITWVTRKTTEIFDDGDIKLYISKVKINKYDKKQDSILVGISSWALEEMMKDENSIHKDSYIDSVMKEIRF